MRRQLDEGDGELGGWRDGGEDRRVAGLRDRGFEGGEVGSGYQLRFVGGGGAADGAREGFGLRRWPRLYQHDREHLQCRPQRQVLPECPDDTPMAGRGNAGSEEGSGTG